MSHALIEQLLKYQPLFHPVVPFEPWREKLVMLDLSVTNTELTDTILEDVHLFSEWVTGKIQQGNARYAIGGYDEHRTVYSKSRVFDAINDREPRRLHLGVDIWGQEGTAVLAPLDGIVHSFAFNNQVGDYGATIILSHRLERQSFFFTLRSPEPAITERTSGRQTDKKGRNICRIGLTSRKLKLATPFAFPVN